MKYLLVCLLILMSSCDFKYSQTDDNPYGLELSCFDFGYNCAKNGWVWQKHERRLSPIKSFNKAFPDVPYMEVSFSSIVHSYHQSPPPNKARIIH